MNFPEYCNPIYLITHSSAYISLSDGHNLIYGVVMKYYKQDCKPVFFSLQTSNLFNILWHFTKRQYVLPQYLYSTGVHIPRHSWPSAYPSPGYGVISSGSPVVDLHHKIKVFSIPQCS